jgi:glycosyltransferase involved in cell wall biosynthesis
VTFPSLYEGFGNAFLEAIYLKKPLLVNRYATFVSDIEPRGFDLVTMDATLTADTVLAVREILESPHRAAEMVNHNYEIAKQHFSYDALRSRLDTIMDQRLGKKDAAGKAFVYRMRPKATELNIGSHGYPSAYMKN